MTVANQIDFKTLSKCKDFPMALMSRIGNMVSPLIIIFTRKTPLIESGCLFDICDIGGGVTHTAVSLNSDWPSIRAFTMHLTIIFRYKVTDNTNISRATPKKFLSHVKIKNEPIMYLAEKAITNFENVNGSYVVSYTTKCISNLEILLMK